MSTPLVTLAGRTIVVTGAGQGIGKAIIELVVELGGNAVALDMNGATLAAALEKLPKAQVLGVVGSVTDAALAARAVEDAVARFGAVHGLVNNAGITRPAMIDKMSAQQWQEVIDVHLTGSFYWTQAVGRHMLARAKGGDAAGLAFEALEKARANGSDVLIIDTAGRLQNKAGLMAELEKIARVIKKLDPAAPHAALLVLDATTGQNAIAQVEAFTASVPLTGLVMTKLDGTAKGGILVALAARFALPVHYLGVGEGEDDLQAFDAQAFARALSGVERAGVPT